MPDDVRRALAIRRLLESYGLPGAASERKAQVLADTRRVCLRDFGYLPEWWIELRDQVEEGRL